MIVIMAGGLLVVVFVSMVVFLVGLCEGLKINPRLWLDAVADGGYWLGANIGRRFKRQPLSPHKHSDTGRR